VRFGLASGLFFAGVVLTLRWLRDVDSAWLAFLNHAVTCLLFAPAVVANGVYPHGWQWLYLFMFGGLQMGIPYMLFALSVRRVSGREASALSLLEPILVPVWVYLAWHGSRDYEPPAWTTVIGGASILAGLVFRYARRDAHRLS
jgi:drug/metabolite transporter (DMT)-like permease